LLSDEPGNVSTPPVTERPNAGREREPEAVGPASELARAAQTPSDTADLTQRDIPEEDHERERASEAPARKSADAPSVAIAAVADESPQRSDVTYSATPPSPVSRASNDSGEREPSSDHRAREGGADRADAVVPRIPTLAEAAGRSDDPPDREEIPQRSLAPLPRESSAREAHAERTRIDEGSGLAQALHQLTPDLTAFASRSVTAGMTDLTQIMPIGDDVARTAGFAPPLLKDAQRGDRWTTSQSASSATSSTDRLADASEPPVALGSTLWPSLPETDDRLEDVDDVSTVLRARDRWARLVREQESA